MAGPAAATACRGMRAGESDIQTRGEGTLTRIGTLTVHTVAGSSRTSRAPHLSKLRHFRTEIDNTKSSPRQHTRHNVRCCVPVSHRLMLQ